MWFIADSLPHEILREQNRLDNFLIHIVRGGPFLLVNCLQPFLDLVRKILFSVFDIEIIQIKGWQRGGFVT